jgi:hypothetical protein
MIFFPFLLQIFFWKISTQSKLKCRVSLLFLQGNSNISGSAHLGGAAVAAIAWARIKRGRFWLLDKSTNFWFNLWLTNRHSFPNLLRLGLPYILIVSSDKFTTFPDTVHALVLVKSLKSHTLHLLLSPCWQEEK